MATKRFDHSTSLEDEAVALHAVLVPGFWLGSWAWEYVEPTLRDAGIETHPVTLPGLDGEGSEGVTLETQIDSVVGLVRSLTGEVGLVGHSGGGAVVQGVIDRVPELVRRIVYVDSGPVTDGTALMPDVVEDVALPSWDELAEQNSSVEGMDEEALARFRTRAVAEPAAVANSQIRVTNPRRLDIPASVICTSFPKKVLLQLIAAGVIPSEIGSVTNVRFVDLPTGHWPMFSRPHDLAEILRDELTR